MRPVAGLLCALTLLPAACSSTPGPDVIARHLNERLSLRLAPDIAAGRAVLEPLPDGARVTLAETALFPYGATELDDRGRFVVTSVIQGMVDPRLLQVGVGAAQDARAQAVTQYVNEYLPGIVSQSSGAAAVQPATPGVAITMQAAPPAPASPM